ncbi:hypothetical protein [Serratia marcescens]|uniref:hypothetical protein n=1 Tax=Serratia marcescens TaxID=615 RepID=UPI001EB9CCE2|nr:hypothetical protein [Serratia marcescens]EGT0451654.1 hypothetical protein [Serratia marcescens]MCM2651002.1 hypothetical protein [Serratia marcescens]
MDNLKERISYLESENENLKLDLHAVRVVVTILSTTINSLSGDPDTLSNAFKEGMETKGRVKFDYETSDDYHEKLVERILGMI